ncbi:MAG TPA: hypothetical protein VEK15_07645 [Vicinamibacteria bacterium]|nr:hypothetical protein [Vicinamibacteria bacterium]
MPTKCFARSLGYGVVAALALTPFLLLIGPILGRGSAIALASVLAVSGYLTVVAPSRIQGLRVGLLALAAGLLLLGLAEPPSVLLGAGVLLSVFRSGFLFRSRPARALLVEGSLLGAGLVLARLLASGGDALSLSFALWGFFLVQSLFYLVGGVSAAGSTQTAEDPFTRACREAARLMEDEGSAHAAGGS